MADEKLSHSMRDDTAHGGVVSAKPGENGKAGLPLEGTPMTTGADGKLQPMPSYRTDLGKGQWWHAAWHMSTTIATPAAYAPLPAAFAALTWPGGIIVLLAGIAVTQYCSYILAGLNEWNGVRYYRYRDLTASIYGRPGYIATIIMQQIASIGNNISIQIVAGVSAKAIAQTYDPGNTVSLQEYIIIFGALQLLLSQLPDIHTLRWFNCVATACTVSFTIIATGLSIYNGKIADPSQVSYDLVGSPAFKAFNIMAALGTIAFAFGDTILPEIQATCRDPPISNMRKAVSCTYTIISSTYLMVAISGYWAFGNAVNPYVINSLTQPNWAITVANVCAIVQVAGCYQIYCRPTYEPIEVKLMKHDQGPFSPWNTVTRLAITTTYITLVTLLCCMLPFFGSFVALCGAVGFTPIDFVLPCLLWNKAKKPGWMRRSFHWFIILAYSAVAAAGAIGAIYFINQQVDTYEVFANL